MKYQTVLARNNEGKLEVLEVPFMWRKMSASQTKYKSFEPNKAGLSILKPFKSWVNVSLILDDPRYPWGERIADDFKI